MTLETPIGDVKMFEATLGFESYAPHIGAPLLWIGATNDFHGIMDDTYRTGERIRRLLRIWLRASMLIRGPTDSAGSVEQIMETTSAWIGWAILSAVFAALTAIFAKIGLEGVDSDLATLVRTMVILVLLAAFVVATGKWQNPLTLSTKTLAFLTLSGVATGASWVCYFRALKVGEASKVAPIDKLSVVLVALFAVLFLHERPSVREWAGILMVGAGVLVLALRR